MSNYNEDETDEVRVQVPVNKKYIERIDALAEKMGVGRGRMIAMLLEAGVNDNEWIINVVTSKWMEPVAKLIKAWDKGKSKPAPKGA